MPDKPIAIGLLTAHELGLLGKSFDRFMPLPADDSFADILAKFDAVQMNDGKPDSERSSR